MRSSLSFLLQRRRVRRSRRRSWAGPRSIVTGINVFRADDNYRIPDVSYVSKGREGILAEDGARGGPDAVIEVRSPGDETYDKLPFHATLGVRFGHEPGPPPRLIVEDASDPSSRVGI
jgi:hypothetical protein